MPRRPVLPWSRVRRALLMVGLLLTGSCSAPDAPPPEPDCSTPRDAADSLFVWQTAAHYDLSRAATCVGGPPETRAKRAEQLKAVLDARGVWAPIDALPDTADPGALPESGRIELTEEPPVWLERTERGWVYSADTIARVPRWHAETFSPLALALQRAAPGLSFQLGPFAAWQLVFGALLIVVAVALSWGLRRVLVHLVFRLLSRFEHSPEAERMRRFDRPVGLSAMFAILAWGLPQLQLPIAFSATLTVLIALAMRLSMVWVGFIAIDTASDMALRFAARTDNRLDDQLIPLLRSTGKTIAIAIGAFAILQAIGVDVWKLVAGASVGGIIIGLAAQDSMKNFFGSLNVFIDQPFQVGDWIVVGSVEGTVEEVGFRSTRVRTFHNSQVTVPNSAITNANVDNMGRRPRRRVKLTLSLTYDTPPDSLQAYVEGVRAILAAHPSVENTYEAHVYDFAGSSIQILAYYHLVVPDWHAELTTRSQNLIEFIRLADTLGVSFAFPSQSLYLEATPDQPLPPHPSRTVEELTALAESFGPSGERARPEGAAFPHTYDAPLWARRGTNAGRGSVE